MAETGHDVCDTTNAQKQRSELAKLINRTKLAVTCAAFVTASRHSPISWLWNHDSASALICCRLPQFETSIYEQIWLV